MLDDAQAWTLVRQVRDRIASGGDEVRWDSDIAHLDDLASRLKELDLPAALLVVGDGVHVEVDDTLALAEDVLEWCDFIVAQDASWALFRDLGSGLCWQLVLLPVA